MKKKQLIIQSSLVAIGLLLFVFTYFYYPSINKNKIIVEETFEKDSENLTKEENTAFENIEYKGLYDFDKPFKVKSKNAFILNEEPDIVYMENMHVILYLDDNRIVEITSQKGRYNKSNYNCYFENDIVASDGDTLITAQNLDLLAAENFVEIYNDVSLDYTTGSLKADRIEYDFKTKNFKVSMYDDKTIKMKVVR